jgi:DNA-binding CsgD family transcriptional regulator
MEFLALTDVEQIVYLVSQAADPRVEVAIPQRKRMLLEGVAKLVAADIWLWTTTVFNSSIPGDSMATNLIDGGWTSEQEIGRFYEALSDPGLRPFAAKSYEACRGNYVTLERESFVLEEDRTAFDAIWTRAGIGHFLVSHFPLGDNAASSIGLYRRSGAPSFTDRERALVHVIFHQVDWLHRHSTEVPAKDKVLNLSRRERQVMIFLLGGDSQKAVARKLDLSEHTVGDYVKRIYREFSVNSRAELLAHFIAGGQR